MSADTVTIERRVRALKIGAIALVFAVLPWLTDSSLLERLFFLIMLFAMFGIGLNIVFGHTDQLYLFVGALAGIGGYTTVMAADALGMTPWMTIPAGVIFAGLIGGAVSFIAARRRFTVILIAVFTLTLELAVNQFLVGSSQLTGGSTGLPVQRLGIENELVLYYVVAAVFLGFVLLYDRLINSRFGVAFSAIREDELAAESVGIQIVRYKTLAGVLAAMLIGLTGILYGFFEGRLYPSTYSFNNIDVALLIMLTLGGLRTLYGPIVGAAFIFFVEEQLADTPEFRIIIFGVLLIVLFLYFRSGIVPRIHEFLERRDLDPETLVRNYT
ncbi:ABC transporter permease subunit [Halobellus sp. GM3]|uniref:ABC transporter permease subunit n=1 Tax=Halobellus sp. GM3 TaxID=3458410 RepID=UPI00403D7819